MKRKSGFIEIGRDGTCIFIDRVRVLGVNKKTGLVWTKAGTGSRLQTGLIDAAEVQA